MRTRITEGDLELVRFLGRHRFATVPQVARYAARTEKKVYARLQGLRAHGLVDYRRPLIDPGVYLATRAGLEVAGLDLPVAAIDIRTFFHDRAVAGLAAALEADGASVVSEREMRHVDEERNGEGPRYAARLVAGGRHYPDLAVIRPSGRIEALEVELTPKNRARRERILSAYARARHVEVVTYHVASKGVGTLVARTAARLGITDLVAITPLEAL